MTERLKWWGYRHTNGTLQLKRFLGQRDIDEALQSPFVTEVYGPFEAETRSEAEHKLKAEVART